VEILARSWFNPNLESRYYFVPGLIAVMLMTVSLLLTSLAIVREREVGTIEQLLVTPIRGVELVLGKTIPYLVTGYVIMTIMLGVMMVVFGIHVKGSFLLLYAMSGVFIVGNLGIAQVISTTAATQQQALLTAFLILMPGVLLSGFLFPVRNMPQAIQYVTYLDPLRWYLEILRGIVQKGSGAAILWPAIGWQTGLAALFLATAAMRFRKTAA
jgi:ABC-2 type transport system permease protein